jgi:uncharacterized protein (UPF0262 family)
LWDKASPLRREDWRVSIADLTHHPSLGEEEDDMLLVGMEKHAVVLATFDEQGAPRGVSEVPLASLRKHTDEYLAIIRRMHHDDDNDRSSKMHALDMAKKVVHDAGAKTLAHSLPGFARDHETYRRLFTLVLSLLVDVTTLPGTQPHRRHV